MRIILPLPPTDNKAYWHRGNMKILTKLARTWKEDAQWRVKEQFNGSMSYADFVVGDITFYLKYERDIQGSLKLLFDMMQGILYKNDKQVIQYGPVFKKWDKENPRIEIGI